MPGARGWRWVGWRAGLVALVAGVACFGLLWLTLPGRPRAALHLPGMSGWYGGRDGRTLASMVPANAGAEQQTIHIYDLASGRPRASITIPWQTRLLSDRTEYNYRAAFDQSRGGGYFVLADADRGKVTLWHAKTGEVHAIWPGRYALTSEDDRILAVIAPDGRSVRLRDIASGQELGAIPAQLPERPQKQTHAYQPFAISADGHWLAVADGAEVRLWDVAAGRPGAILRGHANVVQAVAFAPHGDMLASRASMPEKQRPDFELRLWDLGTGTCRRTLELSNRGIEYEGLQFNADGRKLHLGHSYTHRVADLLAWQPTEPTPADPTPGLENCPDWDDLGRAVETATKTGRFSARYNGKTNAIELTTADTTHTLRGFTAAGEYEGSLGFSPDETTLAVAIRAGPPEAPGWFGQVLQAAGVIPAARYGLGDAPMLELWDVATRTHRATLPGHFAGFTEDSRAVMTWDISKDRDLIEVWDLPPRPPLALLLGLSGVAALLAGLVVLPFLAWRRRAGATSRVPPPAPEPVA